MTRCEDCHRLIGLRSAHHAHSHLSAPGASGTGEYATQTFQKVYVCDRCRTVLIRGRNTGWFAAGEPRPPLERPLTAAAMKVAQ